MNEQKSWNKMFKKSLHFQIILTFMFRNFFPYKKKEIEYQYRYKSIWPRLRLFWKTKKITVDFQLEATTFFMRALRSQVEYMYEKRGVPSMRSQKLLFFCFPYIYIKKNAWYNENLKDLKKIKKKRVQKRV